MRKAMLARRYAKALCAALPEAQLDAIREELGSLADMMRRSHDLESALHNETLTLEARTRVLDAVLQRFNPPRVLCNFLHLLLRHARTSLLFEIVDRFDLEADRRLGRLRGEVLVPFLLPDTDLHDLQVRLSGVFEAKVFLSQRLDASLLGGFTVKIGQWLFDASLDSELARFKAHLGGSLEATQERQREYYS